ncbi:hypothetical protein F4818DRAFT_235830 [Hypoxylon cercidicola]|nr:hypothetical protein F4818DRAFT_235830 [Hypoxylon cercidicola]
MLNLIQDGMLVVEPKKRWKIDQVCTEISRIKRSLEPTTELTDAVNIALRVATHEIPSEDQHSGELDAVQIDTLVHHAQGNSGGILTDNGRRRSLSIRSENGDSEYAAKASSSVRDGSKENKGPQDTDSKERQATLNIWNNSTLHQPSCAKTSPQTAVRRPPPEPLVQGEVESRSIDLINTDLVQSSDVAAPLHGQAGHTDREQYLKISPFFNYLTAWQSCFTKGAFLVIGLIGRSFLRLSQLQVRLFFQAGNTRTAKQSGETYPDSLAK